MPTSPAVQPKSLRTLPSYPGPLLPFGSFLPRRAPPLPGAAITRRGRFRPREGERERVTEYEILLLLDPELADEKQAEAVDRLRGLIEQGGGTFERHDVWGRRRLAYPIDKKEEGVYHLVSFSSNAETLDEISRVLKIDDGVMRHMATRRPEGGPSEPMAAAASIGDHVEADPADALEEE